MAATGLIVKLKGDLQTLRRLFENEEALRAGHAAPHRILLIGTGGGMCCIRVAGYLTAWRDAGLERAVDHAITVSGSGGALGAYLSGLSHRAVRMFEQLAVSGFVSADPWYRRRMSLAHLGDVLRGIHSPIAFDQDLIRAHRTTWHVVVTRLSGESFLLDAKAPSPMLRRPCWRRARFLASRSPFSSVWAKPKSSWWTAPAACRCRSSPA